MIRREKISCRPTFLPKPSELIMKTSQWPSSTPFTYISYNWFSPRRFKWAPDSLHLFHILRESSLMDREVAWWWRTRKWNLFISHRVEIWKGLPTFHWFWKQMWVWAEIVILPTFLFSSLSVQILLITVNWNFTQAHRFQKALPRWQLYHEKSAPALPSPGIPVTGTVNSCTVPMTETKLKAQRWHSLQASCTSPLNPILSSFHKRGYHPHPWVLEPPRRHGVES